MEKGVDAGVICLVNNYMKGKEYKSRKYSKKSLDVFFFKFEDKNIPDVKTREVHKNKIKEIHYPFYEDKQKYKFIDTFIYENVYPSDTKGVGKAVSRGLGFTKDLSPVIKELERFPIINKIIVSKDKPTGIKINIITFNIHDLEDIFKVLKPFNDKQSKEKRKITNNLLSGILPSKFKKDHSKYIRGDLTELIINKDLKNCDISEDDLRNIADALAEVAMEKRY